jgi:hypothetical protein
LKYARTPYTFLAGSAIIIIITRNRPYLPRLRGHQQGDRRSIIIFYIIILGVQISKISQGCIGINGITELGDCTAAWINPAGNPGEIYLHTAVSKITDGAIEPAAATRGTTTAGIYMQPSPLVYIAHIQMNLTYVIRTVLQFNINAA